MRFFSEIAVNRPVLVTMIILIVVILGVVSLTNLNVDLFPELKFPVALVMTTYPGASPQEVENLVTKPMESVLGTVNNVKSITSHSLVNDSIIILEFEWGTDMDFATLQMREKVDLIKKYLPADIEQPMVLKMDLNMMPIIMLGVSGDMDLVDLRKLAEDKIAARLERLPGVASVQIGGGLTREVQIELDPLKLDHYGLTFAQVVQALQMDNMNISGGKVGKGNQDLIIRATGEFNSVTDIGYVTVQTPTGGTVRVRDLGRVVDGYQEQETYSKINGKHSISLNIRKQTTANTVKVSREVNKALEELAKELPSNVKISTIVDQADYINMSINNIKDDLIFGSLLSIAILFLFLRSVRSTLIIAISIPVSIIATFALMYFGHLTINMMSLGGLALGVGNMVDNAIVILENIFRHREEGLGRLEAAKVGAAEVTNAVVASTLTSVAVFLPIVFVEGIAGQLFKQLALTVSFAQVASLLVALAIVPMLSARMLNVSSKSRAEAGSKKGLYWRTFGLVDKLLDGLDAAYGKVLAWSLRHRRRVIIFVTLAVVASLALGPMVGAEFIPAMDQGYISINISLPYGSKLTETEKVVAQVEEIAAAIPEIETISTSVGSMTGDLGGLSIGDSENGKLDLVLKSWKERERTTEDVAEYLRKRVKLIPGAKIEVTVGDSASSMGMSTAPVEVLIQGDDLQVLSDLAAQVKKAVESVPGTREVKTSMEDGRPEIKVVIDRSRAALYGLNIAQVAGSVRTAVQGQVATRYRVQGDEVDVRVILPKDARKNLEDLRGLRIATPLGASVPLSEVASFESGVGPNTIERRDQVRTVAVTSQIVGRDLNSVTTDVQAKIAEQVKLPPNYTLTFGGAAKEMAESFGNLTLALILAIVLVYMVMAAQFESLIHPFVIMFSLPVAVIGIILSLFITGRTFSVVAFIGVIMLVGIAVNNGIVLIDYVNQLRQQGMERDQAILKAGPTRLRPILMTALTTILGMVPLALGIGEGAEARAPMATVVIGGLAASTILTLVIVPVVYSIFDDWGRRLSGRRKKSRDVSNTGPVVEG